MPGLMSLSAMTFVVTVRIWRKQHETNILPCISGSCCCADVMMWEILLPYLGPSIQSEHCSNAIISLNIVADHVHLYDHSVAIIGWLLPGGSGSLNMAMGLLYSNVFHSHQISSSRAPLGCGQMKRSHHRCKVNKSAAAVVILLCQYGPKSQRIVSSTFLKALRHF